MDSQIQCPVCTRYFHVGMNLRDHLNTQHLKEQVISALVSFTEASQPSNLCLDHVLKHLDLTDLTNAENSHSALTASAIRVFGAHIKHKYIVLWHIPKEDLKYCIGHHLRKELRHNIQFVSDERLFSSILNLFGPKMESLCIQIKHRFILDKVIEKCAPNLTKLHVFLDEKDLRLNHRFPKLHELSFIVGECNIPNSWSKINEHFPELHCLEIHNHMEIKSEFEFGGTFIDHIPNLTRFVLTGCRYVSAPQLRRISEFVNANKHMNSLRLDAGSGVMDILQAFMNWQDLEITDLHLSSSNELDVRYIEQLRQLRKLLVACRLNHFEILDLNQLEELDILREDYSRPPVDFYASCKNLKKLTLLYDLPHYPSNISTCFERLTNTLHQLKEVIFKMPYLYLIEVDIPIIITGISALMRRRLSLHSIEVIVPRGKIDWSLIQNENWE